MQIDFEQDTCLPTWQPFAVRVFCILLSDDVTAISLFDSSKHVQGSEYTFISVVVQNLALQNLMSTCDSHNVSQDLGVALAKSTE